LIAFCAIAGLAPIRNAAAQVAAKRRSGHGGGAEADRARWSAKRQLLDKDVYNDKNEEIGEIKDVIVSPKKTVSWAIIGVGGFLGLAEKLVAIPMDQLALTKGKLILKGATKDALKAMPEFHYLAT